MPTPQPNNLKPCPFCGVPGISRTKKAVFPDSQLYYVECSNNIDCPVWPITHPAPTAAAAAEKWNTRSYPSHEEHRIPSTASPTPQVTP